MAAMEQKRQFPAFKPGDVLELKVVSKGKHCTYGLYKKTYKAIFVAGAIAASTLGQHLCIYFAAAQYVPCTM